MKGIGPAHGFIKWAAFTTTVNFSDGGANPQGQYVDHVSGWGVSGNLSPPAEVDTLAALGATATYNGHVLGSVITNEGQYKAAGKLCAGAFHGDVHGPSGALLAFVYGKHLLLVPGGRLLRSASTVFSISGAGLAQMRDMVQADSDLLVAAIAGGVLRRR